MKTKKVVINKLSRGEIYGAMRLMKLLHRTESSVKTLTISKIE